MRRLNQRLLLFIILFLVVLGGIVFVWQLIDIPIGYIDFRAYWSASRLLLTGHNPYDSAAMLALERAHVDPNQDFTMMAWNPPPTYVLLLPVAWLPFPVARALWVFVNISLLLGSCVLLSLSYLPPGRKPLIVYFLIAIFFPPALVAILMGQITFLVLFGLAASIFLLKREQFLWSGVALVLTSVKPHLALLVGPYLLLSMAAKRKWSGWLGLGLAGLFCAVILFALRPGWLLDFQDLLKSPPVNWATPTFGGFLAIYGIDPWPRYVGFGFLLLLPFLLKAGSPVSPEAATSVLTLITIPTTFFGWSYDQSLLLIPIAQLVGWLFGPLRIAHKIILLGSMASIMVANVIHRINTTSEVYYLWVPLAWGVLYLVALGMRNEKSITAQPPQPPDF